MASLKRCDHCGKETAEKNICTLDITETFYSSKRFKSVGVGMHLCLECAQLRNELHAELDMEFLYPELKKM
jgi:hypothetical protein